MASYNEALVTKEISRTPENLMTIYLYKEGAWFRSYHYSAYLLSLFLGNKPDGSPVSRPIRRRVNKMDEDCVFIGLNTNMLPKYLPQVKPEDFVNDECVIDLTEKLAEHTELTLESFLTLYGEWRDSLEISETKKKVAKQEISTHDFSNIPFMQDDNSDISVKGVAQQIPRNEKIRELFKMLLKFRTDKTTPFEWGAFISILQQQAVEAVL